MWLSCHFSLLFFTSFITPLFTVIPISKSAFKRFPFSTFFSCCSVEGCLPAHSLVTYLTPPVYPVKDRRVLASLHPQIPDVKMNKPVIHSRKLIAILGLFLSLTIQSVCACVFLP